MVFHDIEYWRIGHTELTAAIPATCEPVQWTEGQDYHVQAYFKSARGQRKGDTKRFQKQKPAPQSGPNQPQYTDFERLKLVAK